MHHSTVYILQVTANPDYKIIMNTAGYILHSGGIWGVLIAG